MKKNKDTKYVSSSLSHNLRADLVKKCLSATREAHMLNLGADTDVRSAKQPDYVTHSIINSTQATYNKNENMQEYRIVHGKSFETLLLLLLTIKFLNLVNISPYSLLHMF